MVSNLGEAFDRLLVIDLPNEKQRLIYRCIMKSHYGLTREQLVEKTGLSRSTIYDNLLRLRRRGRLESIPIMTGRVGRPAIRWRIPK